MKTYYYDVLFKGSGKIVMRRIIEDLMEDKVTTVKILGRKELVHTHYIIEVTTERPSGEVVDLIYSRGAKDIYMKDKMEV